jgi:hypothetical protein
MYKCCSLLGWPSIANTVRLEVPEIDSIPKIPVFSISSNDAKIVLTQLGGPDPPQGGVYKLDRFALHARFFLFCKIEHANFLFDYLNCSSWC